MSACAETEISKKKVPLRQFLNEVEHAKFGSDQLRVGVMYESGIGPPGEKIHGSMYVHSDIRKAYRWYAIATANQAKYAVERRDAAARKLSPEEIAEAERLAHEWKPDPAPCEAKGGQAAVTG